MESIVIFTWSPSLITVNDFGLAVFIIRCVDPASGLPVAIILVSYFPVLCAAVIISGPVRSRWAAAATGVADVLYRA